MDKKVRRRFLTLGSAIDDTAALWAIATESPEDTALNADNLNRAHDLLLAEWSAMQKHYGLTDAQIRQELGLDGD